MTKEFEDGAERKAAQTEGIERVRGHQQCCHEGEQDDVLCDHGQEVGEGDAEGDALAEVDAREEREHNTNVRASNIIAAEKRKHTEEDDTPIHIHHLKVPKLAFVILEQELDGGKLLVIVAELHGELCTLRLWLEAVSHAEQENNVE
jgi:hypothetical protein